MNLTPFVFRQASLIVCLGTLTLSTTHAEDWPRYLGPNYNLVSPESDWSTDWGAEGPRKAWEATVGPGASTVSIKDGRLYTMGNVNEHDTVWCFDAATGKEIWRFGYACPLDKRSFEGGPASTPTVDDGRVYTFSHKGTVHCLDAQKGTLIWKKDVTEEFGGHRPQWGYAGSPLVIDNLLILDVGGPENSTIALDKTDGTLVWGSGRDRAGYASPVPFQQGDTAAVLVFKSRQLVALKLSNGVELWQVPWKTSWDVNASNPIIQGNKIFVTTGYGVGCALLEIKDGEPVVLWKNKGLSPHFATPIIYQNHIYGIDGYASKGKIKCIALQTGEVRWEFPEVGAQSVLIAGGRLLALTEKGELIVGRATPDQFNVEARATVIGGRCWVSPVLSNGRLYCRNNNGKLVCLDLTKK